MTPRTSITPRSLATRVPTIVKNIRVMLTLCALIDSELIPRYTNRNPSATLDRVSTARIEPV